MTQFYRFIQKNNKKEPQTYKKWFARALHTETIETEQLARKMQQNCTLKVSDIVAVLTELTDVLTDELQASHAVHLRGLGTFKIGLNSRCVDSPEDFQQERDIVGTHILFRPETHVMHDGSRSRALIDGTRPQLLPSAYS